MRPEEIDKTEIYELYEKGVNFNRMRHVFSDTDGNTAIKIAKNAMDQEQTKIINVTFVLIISISIAIKQ